MKKMFLIDNILTYDNAQNTWRIHVDKLLWEQYYKRHNLHPECANKFRMNIMFCAVHSKLFIRE